MRIKREIDLPGLPEFKEQARENFSTLKDFLFRLRKAIKLRDEKIQLAINNNDFEIVTSAPSGAPDYSEPVLKLFKNGATWELHIYTGSADGWKKVSLS